MMLPRGKRKRRSDLDEREAQLQVAEDEAHLKELLREHFEASFDPLDERKHDNSTESQCTAPQQLRFEDPKTLWSDSKDRSPSVADKGEQDVQIVDHTRASIYDGKRKAGYRSLMTYRPPLTKGEPSSLDSSSQNAATSKPTNSEETDQSLDLALQRLISESHLLHPSSPMSKGSSAHARALLLNHRLQALGAKSSMFMQRNAPLQHRLGIERKRREKEKKLRDESREAGIVLGKATKDGSKQEEVKSRTRHRQFGVGQPAVGKWSGATLRLSKADLRDIAGTKTRFKTDRKAKKK